ncbi:MAG: HIT family protein [Pseudomonadota bacterium]
MVESKDELKSTSSNQAECLFCQLSDSASRKITPIYEDDQCYAIADKFPLTPGHVLVIPKQHHTVILDYTSAQQIHLQRIVFKVQSALLASNPKFKACNLLLNDGKASGQHIPHTHWHIIPRQRYDTLRLLINLLTRFVNPLNYVSTRTINLNFDHET